MISITRQRHRGKDAKYFSSRALKDTIEVSSFSCGGIDFGEFFEENSIGRSIDRREYKSVDNFGRR